MNRKIFTIFIGVVLIIYVAGCSANVTLPSLTPTIAPSPSPTPVAIAPSPIVTPIPTVAITPTPTPTSAPLPSPSTQDSQNIGMNFAQIQVGDYSSLLGSWTEVAYAVNIYDKYDRGVHWFPAHAPNAFTLSVSSDTIDFGGVIQGNTITDRNGSHALTFENYEGSLVASLADPSVAINWAVYFYPKGTKNVFQPDQGVQIDNTKNLIVIWSSNMGRTEVYAQVDLTAALAPKPGTAQISIGGSLVDTDVTGLNLFKSSITDISGLNYLTNLTELKLDANQISDINVLTGLTNLTTLYLGGNQISDISGLKGLTNLTSLLLSDNQINDISALKELTNLTNLILNGNQISDISALKRLTNLTDLELANNQISDISILKGLTNLTFLRLQGNPLSGSQISDLQQALPNCAVVF